MHYPKKVVHNMRMKVSLMLFSIFGLFWCTPVFAQTLENLPSPVEYTVSPQNPGPEQLVQITATGVGSFLGDATITWSKDGKIVSSGTGDSTFTFTTGPLGSQTTISLTIVSSSEGTLTHSFSISPSLVNLIWQANTTAPPFYKGLPLYSPGADITVVAFPEIVVNKKFISSRALSFQWKLHGTLVPEQSGLGKNTFTFQGDQLKSAEDISVDVYYGNIQVGEEDITIPAISPQIILYVRDPLRGELLDSALFSTAQFVGKEMTVQAEPYFFSNTAQQNNSLQYQWTVNGQGVSGPDSDKGILTLREDGSSSGSAMVDVTLQNINSDQLLQSAQTALQLLIGSGHNLF